MDLKRTAAVVCGIVAVLCANAGLVLGVQPGTSLDEFRSSLDPRVFQPGGYGPWPEPLGPIFDLAARTYNVPRALLLTLGYFGSGFENRGDQPTIEYGYGVMALRDNPWGGDSLAQAARLLNTSAEALKTDPRLNIMGAAAVLDAYANEAKLDRSAGLDIWLGPLIRYAGLDAESSRLFVMEVFAWLKRGMNETNTWAETFSFAPQPVGIDIESLAPPPEVEPLSPDYPPATWDPAASCNYSTATSTKDTVVIHTIEGSYAGCISWFKNCAASVSAHYVLAYDGRITQMVRENQTAWHVSCYNSRAIGLEHEGYASQSHPTSQYNASAALVANICDRWGIPKQKRSTGPGILGHHDVTICCCGTHTDPDPGWDWNYYIQQVNGGPPPPAWAATFTAQSYPSTIEAGTTAIVWAEFRNDGTSSWTHCATKLGTSSPHDRASPFCTPTNWRCADGSNPSCGRPTDVDQSSVGQGAVGRFTFIITAPATPGTYTEKFQLVQEGVTWFGPEITWTITVTASQGTLTGTVRNASNNAAIVGATVTVTGVGSATTNTSGGYTFSNVNAGTYNISVTATGFNPASGNATVTGGQTTTKDFSLTPSDTQAPTTPTGLTANATGPTTVQLSWTASTDNVAVAGYDIQRDGSVIGSSTGTTYTDSGATPDTTLTYRVRAKDAVPNYSAWSDPASARTPPAPPQWNTVFTDGFNGNLNNWTQQVGGFAYSTTINHGTYTGGGAAYCAATETDQMYHLFARPFAQGKVSGYFYDGKGGWKQSVCGWAYRQSLSLRALDGTGTAMIIDNCLASNIGNGSYYWRTVGGGGVTYTAYATRNPATDCNGAWIYFETNVTPAAPGASPSGSFVATVTDGAGTTTTTQNLTTDFGSYGIGRITLGLGVSSANECYWDDIAFSALPPDWPIMNTPTAVSSTSIQWNFSPRDNNFFGWDVADGAGAILSPQYPAAGWLNRSATSWVESGLAPNTSYTRKVRAWNGTLNSAFSLTASAYTLSVPPGAGSVTPDNASVCVGDNVIWTAVGGFGPGKVQYYRYAWNQNPTHAFTGAEPMWSSGSIATQPTAAGTWYLHVQGFNGANAPNGTCDYPVVAGTPPSISEQPAPQTVCIGATVQFTVAASGAGLSYQWQADGSNLSDDTHYSGATTNTLTIVNADTGDAASYRCVITGTCGSVTSAAAALSFADAPAISQQPVTQHVCAGGTATFTVSVTGEPSPGYRWQKDGVDLTDGGHYSGATSPTLTVAGADESDVADYRCVVTGGCGTVASDPATLVLQTATTITQQPESQSAPAGSAAVFTIVAAGTGSLTYQWQKDGEDIPGATTDTLSLNPVRRADAGNYRCLVTSDCGSVASAEATLTVAVYPADFDEDGDVDLTDFATFQGCFNGPNRPAKPGCAGSADFDGDLDVDLADFTMFQSCFNGPNRPPKAACPQE